MSSTQPQYFNPSWIQPSDEVIDVDICVYGGNAAGVIAAIKATRLGHTALILQPGMHLGGMTSGGLGWTDYGRKHVIGGMSRQFYRDLGERAEMGDECWHFWPSDATSLFTDMVKDAGVDVRFGSYLDSVDQQDQRIQSITLLGGLQVKAKQFIDCTYEGDLMAAAKVDHTIGRESNQTYDESLNGLQCRDKHQFKPARIDPYIEPGNPDSGLLPFVEARELRNRSGDADHKVQAYNFRMCMTDDPQLKVEWEKPEGFEPGWYELAARWFESDASDDYNKMLRDEPAEDGFQPLAKFDVLARRTPGGHRKTDTNNHGPFSSDFIGANYAWPTADYSLREQIFQNHVRYQKGFYWFMANDPRIPDRLRKAFAQWGLPKDEFAQTNHWPHQLYVREARRMVGDHVITEHDCTGKVLAKDSVGMGSYTMDSHNCSRFVAQENGKAVVLNEGDVQVPPTDPYPVSYRAVVPKRGECENLFVPVCFSASHIAYGSARMEPVFMVLGESVACAASLAITDNVASQDVEYKKLRPMLEEAKQVLEL